MVPPLSLWSSHVHVVLLLRPLFFSNGSDSAPCYCYGSIMSQCPMKWVFLSLLIYFKVALAIFEILLSHTNFRVNLWSSSKNPFANLMELLWMYRLIWGALTPLLWHVIFYISKSWCLPIYSEFSLVLFYKKDFFLLISRLIIICHYCKWCLIVEVIIASTEEYYCVL